MIGGFMYVSGMIIMLWNVIKTVKMGQVARIKIPSTVVHA